MIMIVRRARGLSNRSAPAAVLILMRRQAIPLSAPAFVRQFVKVVKEGALLSAADPESPVLPAGLQRLNPPAQQ